MKRLVMGLGIVLAASGCSSQQTASANSEETIRTTAIANIVAAMPNQTPTPVGNEATAAGPENGAAPSDLSNMVTNLTTQE